MSCPVDRFALLLCGALLWPAALAQAQSETLHLPDHPRAEAPQRVIRPAPLTPVHQDRSHHHTPVIAPRHEPPRHRPPVRHPPHASAGKPHAPAAKPGGSAAGKPEPKPLHEAARVPVPARKPVPAPEPDKGTTTGLPLPRFAALRTDEVNLRTGPGTRYPIEWVYKRRYLPVEIEREFDVWRLVRMPDGTRGWVHQATLTGRRGFDVEKDTTLRAEPRDTARAVAELKPGVVGRLRSCSAGSAWCRVQVGSYGGYIPRDALWGTLPNEVVR